LSDGSYPVWRLDVLGMLFSLPVLAGAVARRNRELTRRVFTLMALTQIVCLAMALPAGAFPLLLAVMLGVGAWELWTLYGRSARVELLGLIASSITAMAATLLVPVLAVPQSVLAVVSSIGLLVDPWGSDRRFGFGWAALVLVVASGLGSLAALLAGRPGAAFSVLFLSQMHDSGALLGGRAFGGHRPFPGLSPNKTTAGYLCGAVGTSVGLLVLPLAIPGIAPLSAVPFVVAVIFVSISAGGGDLVFSAWKRAMGTKDFSRVLGPHGGVLDRIGNICIMASILRGAGVLGWSLLYNV
jgi:phosphatidate cytidylyltransferase